MVNSLISMDEPLYMLMSDFNSLFLTEAVSKNISLWGTQKSENNSY